MKITIYKLMHHFNLVPDNYKNCDTHREILNHSIIRVGLELASDLPKSKSYSKSIIGWGTKEIKYLSTIKKEIRIQKFKKLFNKNTPAIILSVNFGKGEIYQEILEIGIENQIPIFSVDVHLQEIILKINEYFLSIFKEIKVIHGSLIVVNGVGTLIIGNSGIGKSEAILELIQKDHTFISDDSVEIYKIGKNIYGRSSQITQDLLEVRGIGLINVPFIYGTKSIQKNTPIDIVVELLTEKKINDVNRLGDQNLKYAILGKKIPMMQIPIVSGRSISSLVTAVISVFLAKRAGMNPIKTINDRIRKENNK